MTDELKPCQYCGGEAETCSHYFEEKDMTLWQVRCKERPYDVEHPCYTADSLISFTTEEEAVEAWNTRAERTCRPVHTREKWQCGAFGCVIRPGFMPEFNGVGSLHYCPNCGAKVVRHV